MGAWGCSPSRAASQCLVLVAVAWLHIAGKFGALCGSGTGYWMQAVCRPPWSVGR
jgi:hypothetical protein